MRYRRSTTPGATYFFTVVTYRRRAMLCEPDTVAPLREAFATVKQRHPFRIDAVVILPDHWHGLWTLPPDDADDSTRWMRVKSHCTRRCAVALKTPRSPALRHKRAPTIWQPRYWEHPIRDDRDFERHCDYLHDNPVKHGLVAQVADWPHSSFHRFVENGAYPLDWAGHPDLADAAGFGA
jgi:putative transposase